MLLTKESVEARKAKLIAEQQGVLAQANMYSGAIKDLDWVLEQLADPEPVPAPVEVKEAE